jgi:acetyltransferase-like isoleucine patch superfamily enzyme
MKVLRRDLILDLSSIIGPKLYKTLSGNSMYKIRITKSTLGGDISADYGCNFNNVICSGSIKLGRFVSLNGPGTRLSAVLNGIEIGSFTSIASNVIIQEEYHRMDRVTTYLINKNIFKKNLNNDIYSKGKIKIEEDVWIGSNSVILSGVTIGRGSIIGAGSIITKDVPRYSIVIGNPAKILKLRFSENIIRQLEKSKWWEMDVANIISQQSNFNKNLNNIKSNEYIFNNINN